MKPDGLFIATVLGGRTLTELRQSLLAAEEEIRGGAANRVSPMMDVIDAAGLLQRTQFAMPVADNDARIVRYASSAEAAQRSARHGRDGGLRQSPGPPLTRGILMRAMDIYAQRFSDPDGPIRATFEFVTLSGWALGPDQPKQNGQAAQACAWPMHLA